MNSSPKSPSGNGRDTQGRFAKGNPGGTGNPYAKRVAALRAALLDAVTGEDMGKLVRALVAQALGGDVAAAREVLLRVLGKPTEADLLERLEALEAALDPKSARRAP